MSGTNPQKSLIRQKYGPLSDALSKILFEADPIEINYVTNTDEYDSEVETILPRLEHAKGQDDVRQIVHEEFCTWFDPECVGPMSAYDEIASKVWAEWQVYLASSS